VLRIAVAFLVVSSLLLLVAPVAAGQGVLGRRYIGLDYDVYWPGHGFRQGGTADLSLPVTANLDLSLGYSFVLSNEDHWSGFSSLGGALVAHGSSTGAAVTPYLSASAAYGLGEYNDDLSAGLALGLEIDLGESAAIRPQVGWAATWPEHGWTDRALTVGLGVDIEVTDVVFLLLGGAFAYGFDGGGDIAARVGLGFRL